VQLEKTIAVLPFRNLTNDSTQLYFCEGFMEEILNNLQKINSFTVRSRTSSDLYRDTKKPITVIGNELNANYLIEGSVGREGNTLKIWVQLIDAKADKHIWANDYNRELKQVLVLQSDIAKDIASQLRTILSPEEKGLIEKSQTENPEAYNLYLQGRFYWNKRTEEGQKKSIEYFEKSVTEDPNFALAFAGLADAYFILSWYGWFPKTEGYAKAKEFALRAIDLDKDLAEAHATLGTILCWNDWKWEESRKELLLAIRLNPNYATGYQYYSELLDIIRVTREAQEQINIALELDPFNPTMNIISAILHQREGKLKEWLNEWRKVQEFEPSKTLEFYMTSFYYYVREGDDSIALEYLQKAMPKNASALKDEYIKSGMKGIFNWIIEWEIKKPVPNRCALAGWYYAWLGNKEEALKSLEKALEERASQLPRINNDPDFDYLRSEPRFQAIIKKMGLSEYQLSN
jgi:TolB-like protein/Tfp pilus assembly protein PilF